MSYTVGDDLRLRHGKWSFGIMADSADRDTYCDYDLDEHHNQLRAQIAPMAEQVARLQFEVPGA